MASERTVKVRIAVAVDESGDWNSAGWRAAPDKRLIHEAMDGMCNQSSVFWLTAELPIPTVQTVAASVEEVEGGK